MSNLDVVCLISGGKDSLFSILHCQKNGHSVVALANLHPPQNGVQEPVDDLDSYMYQTIGHAIIPLYEQALGLPLYRQEIHGSAVNQDKCYGPNASEDETEALVPLLRRVQLHHPQVNAVSTGAILSDYQRTRVESVAIRLGLTPLSYLWQYPNLPPHSQTSLLEHMAAVGQDSRIVKVASGGLDDAFLWHNVADSRTITRLEKATRRFGSTDDGAVLGEGGEYETLAVAGPSCLWKGGIEVHESDMKVVSGDAGSVSLSIAGAQVSSNTSTVDKLNDLHTPALLEPLFRTVLDELDGMDREAFLSDDQHDDPYLTANVQREAAPQDVENEHSHSFVADLIGDGSTAAEEMRSIMENIRTLLHSSGNEAKDVACTSIILRDMAEFSTVNSIYSAYFRHPNPPARVTIACADVLPEDKQVMASLTVTDSSDSGLRNGLHVQSRSYWAPANIGPYSQAIAAPYRETTLSATTSLVYVAGQIPLIPATMELAGAGLLDEIESFSLQAVLSLQHTIRIGRAMQVKQWAGAIAFITGGPEASVRSHAHIARQTWNTVHEHGKRAGPEEEQEDTDLWEARFGANRSLSALEEQSKGTGMTMPRPSALHVVHVDALPRNAAIEWVVYGLTTKADDPMAIPQHAYFLRTFARHLVE